MKKKWLDRNVCAPGPLLQLCLTDKDLFDSYRELKAGSPPYFVSEGADATTHFIHSMFGLAAIVCIRPKEGIDPIQTAAMLVHEAVHVWQKYAASIGELNPGEEQESYAIQAISQALMYSYADQTVKG